MGFEEIAKAIWQQFVTVWEAPVPYIATVLFAGWLIWLVVKHTYATRLANAESAMDLQDRKLQDYKDKLDGASPEEAKAHIDALEARLDGMLPRRLSAEQQQRMLPFLIPFAGLRIAITLDGLSAESRPLAEDFIAIFTRAGWNCSTLKANGIAIRPQSGIGFRVPNPAELTAPQRGVIEALNAGNLNYGVQRGQPEDLTSSQQPIAEILVTSPSRQ